MMNEYVADYTPVEFKGKTYYPQPKVSRDRLRRFYVFGLDSSDREVGVFHSHGIATVQPYSALAEAYLTVPESLIERKDCKEILNLPLIKEAGVADLIVKTKVRAQVGGKDGGTLGLFHDNDITEDELMKHWSRIFAPMSKDGTVKPLIFSGRYRSE